MPCTAGIKVIAAYVGVPVSDAYMMMGWNAMTAKHKELLPQVQQASMARISLWHSTHCQSPLPPFHLPIGAEHVDHQGGFLPSPKAHSDHPDKGNCITVPRFS